VKANWAEKALEDVCSIDYGTRIVRKHSVGTEYPVYGGGNETFRAGHYNRTDTVVVARFAMSEECTRFVKGQFFLNDSGLTVAPLQEDLLTCDYVNAWLLASNVQIFALGRGTAQRNLDVPAFRRMTFRFPTSIDEQRRIVAKLDAISAQVAAATENRKAKALALKAARSALLQQLCMEPHPGGAANEVWPLVALQEITTLFTDGDWIESKDQASDGVRLLQTGNVGSGAFLDRRSKARFISDETFGRLRCTEVLTGDCLISRLPDPVGRACLVPESDSRMITAVDCTIVRFDATRITPEYFVYYSGSYSYQLSVDALTTGATRSRISRKNLGGIPVPLPPLDEQRRIVAKLDEATAAIDSLESGVDAAAQELDALTASALSSLLAAGT